MPVQQWLRTAVLSLVGAVFFASPAFALVPTVKVPEPNTLSLLAAGAAAYAALRWRRK